MKLRPGPLVALLLLVGLSTWAYLAEYRGSDERKRVDENHARPIPFERHDLEALTIENDHGRIRIASHEGGFRIAEPLSAPADAEAIESLLSSLEIARIERRIEAGDDLASYGLDRPRATLTVELASSQEPLSIAVGSATPIGDAIYVLLPGEDEVGVVTSSIGDLANQRLLRLRDKSVLPLDPWKMNLLTIERAGGGVRLEKPESGWEIVEPVQVPADGPTVTELLSAVDRLLAMAFVSESPTSEDLQRFGLEPPSARLTVLQEGWSEPRTIEFGAATEDARYLRVSGRDPVVQVSDDIWDKVQTRLFDLRRKDLLGMSQYDIETMTASRTGEAAVLLARMEDRQWEASGRVSGIVSDDIVDALVRVLGTARAVGFIDEPPEQLRAALASRPVLDLTIGGKRGDGEETTLSQHLLFGAKDPAGRVPVRDLSLHFLMVIDAATFDRILYHLQEILDAVQPAEAPPAGDATPPAD
ncbi:MAG: DUF4340 domain-containing protein [Acidobacteria bacterium]|nr:DUF4340 domain-containing protein [Acidobacteriota bacterium]